MPLSSKWFASLALLMAIVLPNGWIPRDYQLPGWEYLENGGKRAVFVWHRRAGKDSVAINWTAICTQTDPGVYWHMAPEAKQGRKIVWDGVDRAGRRVIDQAFPKALRDSENDTEMRIRFKNGSIWQVVGSDNYDSLVGANPKGVVFSEYPLGKPEAWTYIRPILAENGGWAIFPYTPRGRNHGKDLFDLAQELGVSGGWFAQLLRASDTKAIPAEVLEQEKRELSRLHGEEMGAALYEQEYECSFEAVLVGCIFPADRLAAYGKRVRPATVRGYLESEGDKVLFRQADRGWLEVWDAPRKFGQYVLGADVAEGLPHGDLSVGQVLQRGAVARQAARLCPKVEPDDFGRFCVRTARYYNQAWLGIERNNHGHAALIAARDTGYDRLFRMAGLGLEGREVPKLGWLTTSTTRDPMLDDLVVAVRDGALSVNSEETLSQMKSFVRNDKGRAEGAEGCKDDDVMALGIAVQLLAKTEAEEVDRFGKARLDGPPQKGRYGMDCA